MMAANATPSASAVADFIDKLKLRMTELELTPVQLAKKANVGYPYL